MDEPPRDNNIRVLSVLAYVLLLVEADEDVNRVFKGSSGNPLNNLCNRIICALKHIHSPFCAVHILS